MTSLERPVLKYDVHTRLHDWIPWVLVRARQKIWCSCVMTEAKCHASKISLWISRQGISPEQNSDRSYLKYHFLLFQKKQRHSSLKKTPPFHKPQCLIPEKPQPLAEMRKWAEPWTAEAVCQGPGHGLWAGKGTSTTVSVLNVSWPSQGSPVSIGKRCKENRRRISSSLWLRTHVKRNLLSPGKESPESWKPNSSWSKHKAGNPFSSQSGRPYNIPELWEWISLNFKGCYGPIPTKLKRKSQKNETDSKELTACQNKGRHYLNEDNTIYRPSM